MEKRNLTEYLIQAGIIFYLLIIPLGISVWMINSLEVLPVFFGNKSVIDNVIYFALPILLILTTICFAMMSEYAIPIFLLYIIISILTTLASDTSLIDGVVFTFFNLGGSVGNICLLLYFMKIQRENKFTSKIGISEKNRIEFTKISSEIQRRGFLSIFSICIGFLSVLALGKMAFILSDNSFSVIPDEFDTVLLILIMVMYILAGVLSFKEQSIRWVPYLIATFILVIKTACFFHILQLSSFILPVLFLFLEWKVRKPAELLLLVENDKITQNE